MAGLGASSLKYIIYLASFAFRLKRIRFNITRIMRLRSESPQVCSPVCAKHLCSCQVANEQASKDRLMEQLICFRSSPWYSGYWLRLFLVVMRAIRYYKMLRVSRFEIDPRSP